jgi:hypothetical protein
MTREIQNWIQSIAPTFEHGRVLEIGAYNVNGTVRQFFKPTEYIGTDMQAGPNVDKVLNNADLVKEFGFQSFDTVIACETLEHDITFWRTVQYLRAITRKYLIITTPTFNFPLHRYPKDYWRFGEDAYREVFFEGMEVLNLTELKTKTGNVICGLAKWRDNGTA